MAGTVFQTPKKLQNNEHPTVEDYFVNKNSF